MGIELWEFLTKKSNLACWLRIILPDKVPFALRSTTERAKTNLSSGRKGGYGFNIWAYG